MEAARLNLRLFVDGYEIPVIGARCEFTEGAPATASIQVIATDAVWKILPRAFVALFYYHSGSEGLGTATSDEGGGKSTRWGPIAGTHGGPSSYTQSSPYDPREYKLLFMGTMIGIGFQKSSSQRAAVFNCADPTELLDRIQQHGTTKNSGGLAAIENSFLGVNMGEATSNTAVGSTLSSNLQNWITASTVDGEMNLMAGIQRTIRELFFLGSVFYSRHYNKLRIGHQIVGLREDLTSSKLMALAYFKKFLRERVNEQQAFISGRQMIDLLLAPILSNYVTIPCPMFDPEGACLGMTRDDIEDTELDTMIPTRQSYMGAAVNYVVLKPDSWFLPAPSCNLIFPHMYEEFSMSRSYTQEPTRMLMRTDDMRYPRSYVATPGATTADGEPLINPTLRTPLAKRMKDRLYAPDFEFFTALLDTQHNNASYLSLLHNRELPHEFFVGPTTAFMHEGVMGRYAGRQARRKYLSYFTDYLYWKIRFGARSGSVSMGFTPNLIPGYPAVVFDRASSHYVGHVQSITHSITQNGGTTTVSLIAVRTHDEDIDFAEQDRSQEEVIMGLAGGDDGTKDTFFDERYAADAIGDSVYTPLFGTTSIMDLYDDFLEGIEGASDLYEKKSVENAINVIFHGYTLAVQGKMNLGSFTQGLTHRPKANFVDIMGFSSASSWEPFAGDEFTMASEFFLQYHDVDGFMVGAFNDTHPDANLEFLTKNETTTVSVENYDAIVNVTRLTPLVSDGDSTLVSESRTVQRTRTSSTTTDTGKPANYNIHKDIIARQGYLQEYVEGLLLKGLRG